MKKKPMTKGTMQAHKLAKLLVKDSEEGIPLKCHYGTVVRILVMARKYIRFVKRDLDARK